MPMQENCSIQQIAPMGAGLFSILIQAPQIAAQAQPGQFVHISCGEGNLLRRPISICEVEGETLRVVFQVKGEGTQWLSKRKAGDILDVLGALGHGYDLSKLGTNPVFIGGGIGVPPMLYTMQQARQNGAQPTAILGFRSKDAVILEAEFGAQGDVFVTTDDGSYGRHGFVTQVLQEKIEGFTAVCACGPKPMLQAIAQIAQENGVLCQVSMEERMGCGIGACLVCACGLKAENGETRYGHVCKDGPVFDAQEVEW